MNQESHALFSVVEQDVREREYTFFKPREETVIGQGVLEGSRAAGYLGKSP